MNSKSWILERMRSQGMLKTQDDIKEPKKLQGRTPDLVILDDVYQEQKHRANRETDHVSK